MNNYFSHDSNARNSDKLIPVRIKWGAEGYGVYFMILERLRDEPEYMSVKDYNMIAFDLRVSTGIVKSIIEDFGLFHFTEDGKLFYSEGFLKRMEKKDDKSKKAQLAAQQRWEKQKNMQTHRESDADALQTHAENDAKKRKGKKSKEVSPHGDTKKGAPPGASPSPYPLDVYEKDLQKCKDELFNDRMWIELLCMNNHLSPEKLSAYLDNFFIILQNRGETTKTLRDAKHHFASWLQIELKQKGKKDERNQGSGSGNETQPVWGAV